MYELNSYRINIFLKTFEPAIINITWKTCTIIKSAEVMNHKDSSLRSGKHLVLMYDWESAKLINHFFSLWIAWLEIVLFCGTGFKKYRWHIWYNRLLYLKLHLKYWTIIWKKNILQNIISNNAFWMFNLRPKHGFHASQSDMEQHWSPRQRGGSFNEVRTRCGPHCVIFFLF